MSRLGEMLKAYRQKHNMSQQQLAKEIGIERSLVSRLEVFGDRAPDAAGLVAIMRWALGHRGADPVTSALDDPDDYKQKVRAQFMAGDMDRLQAIESLEHGGWITTDAMVLLDRWQVLKQRQFKKESD